MPIDTITQLTTPTVSRSIDAETFIARSDRLISELPVMIDEFNIFISAVNALADVMSAQMLAAIAAVNAEVWVSGANYTIGEMCYSPSNLRTYRRKTDGAGTTDPASDTANWGPPVAVDTTSLTGILKGNGSVISAAVAGTDYVAPGAPTKSTIVAKGNSGSGTVTYDVSAADTQICTSTAAHTVAFTGWPADAEAGLHLYLDNGGTYAPNFGTTVTWIKLDGTETTSFATYLAANTGRTTLQAAGTDQFMFWSKNGGTKIYGRLV